MNKQKEVDKAIEALLSGDADRIDAIHDDSVLVAAIAKIESSGGIPRQALHALDTVYQARLIDVAQYGTKAEEALAFARHLYAMANDSRAESLAEFIHRWRAYADTAVLVARMES